MVALVALVALVTLRALVILVALRALVALFGDVALGLARLRRSFGPRLRLSHLASDICAGVAV